MSNKNQYILTGAEVIVNAPRPNTSSITYPRSCTVVDHRGNRVTVTPLTHNDVPNEKVWQEERVKVMTRKDGTYMLYFCIIPGVDCHEMADRLEQVRHGMEAAFGYEEQRRLEE